MRATVGASTSVPSDPFLISLVDMVSGLGLSVSDFEVDEWQTLTVSKMRGASVALERKQPKRAKSKHGNNASPIDVGAPRGRQLKQFLSA